MLEIKELHLQAIGRFVEPQVIYFDKLGNLVQVDGIRNDTGGSSGSGKSTVFNSLDYLFGLNDIPDKVLQSRFTKEGIQVTMIGAYNDLPLTIIRGKGKISVDLNGEIITGSKLAEEKIDEILGMSRKLFRPMLHKRQKEGGFFLQFTPGQIHEFLTDALGLSAIRNKAELVEKKLKALNDEITLNQGLVNQSRAALEATISASLALGAPPVQEVDQSAVLALKKAYDASLEALVPVKARHAAELQALEGTRPQPRSVNADQSALKALEERLSTVRRKVDEIVTQNGIESAEERGRAKRIQSSVQSKKVEVATLSYHVQNGNRAKTEAGVLSQEIKKIRESICPTCEQNWATEAAKARETELLAKIKVHGDSVLLGVKSAQDIVRLNTEIADLEPLAIEKAIPMPGEYTAQRIAAEEITTRIAEEHRHIRDVESAEHHANRVLAEQFGEQQRTLVQKHSLELQQVTLQADTARRAFETSVQKLRHYEEARSSHTVRTQALRTQQGEHSSKLLDYQTKVEALNVDLLLAEELKKAVKGYASCAFDEALEYIGSTATEIIRSIPNMANATIQLEGTRETQKGKVNEEVNAVISMDGETGIPIKSLSGGERSSVDLAVDLAVIDLLENRTNKGINIFILDEPFTGLDFVSIEMAIEKLRSLNKRLVIVDHNPEVKQMVESRLLVVREGLTSTIVQN